MSRSVAADDPAAHGPPLSLRQLPPDWRQDTTAVAACGAKLTQAAVRFELEAMVVQKLTVARVADALP